MRAGLAALAGLWVAGCATVSPERGHDQVARVVSERTGYATRWEGGPPAEEKLRQWIASALEGGLTRDEAVELALVNNPSLGQVYEELGISQAELVEAGLLKNPKLELGLGFPQLPGAPSYEVSVAGNLLQLLILPLRRQVAADQFTADTRRVTHAALKVAAQVSSAYAKVQAAHKGLELDRMTVESAAAMAALADEQFRAGNVTELELMTERAEHEQARLEATGQELSLLEAREALNRLMGLWGTNTDWTLAEQLPAVPPEETPADALEALAIQQRLDVDAARLHAALMAQAVGLARTTSLFGHVEVGVHYHEGRHGRVVGPKLELELPIFNQRQGLIARLEAQQRKSELRLKEVAVEARSEVRLAQAQLQAARSRAEHYRTALLPLRDRVLALTLLQYNAMNLSPYKLLHAKRKQVHAYRKYLDAVRDYWIARAELDRAVGGRAPAGKLEPLKLDVTPEREGGAPHHGH